MRQLRAIDLYCGAGGTTTGAHESGLVDVVVAVNHWLPAIRSHQSNYPGTRHICASIDEGVKIAKSAERELFEHREHTVDPREFVHLGIDWVFASPECTHFSGARGGRPVLDQKRMGGRAVLNWVETLKPAVLVLENVREWLTWGPVLRETGRPIPARKGQYFRQFVAKLESLGYAVDWKLLNAADYGEATSRVRLFLIARRDGKPICWPKPKRSRKQWRPAAEIIQWDHPCPSIFDRKRPLAAKTLLRIETGIKKFCSPDRVQSFLVTLRQHCDAQDLHGPIGTITASGTHHGLAMPFAVNMAHSFGRDRCYPLDRPLSAITTKDMQTLCMPFVGVYHNGPDGANRNVPVDEPLPTLDTQNRYSLVAPFVLSSASGGSPRSIHEPLPSLVCRGGAQLCLPYLVDVNHGGDGDRSYSVDRPLTTITTRHGRALCMPFIAKYYGTGRVQSVDEPLHTITATDRFGLAEAVVAEDGPLVGFPAAWLKSFEVKRGMSGKEILARWRHARALLSLLRTMREHHVIDVGFRMLIVRELARATGFPESYKLHGSKQDQTRLIGNAVCPGVAKAICEAIAAA